MYYYKTKTWFAPVNNINSILIQEGRLAVYFTNGIWKPMGEILQLLDETGKIINTYDTCNSTDSEIIQNRFETIITDFIQLNKPTKIY